jgi:hypothetical protein
LQKVNDSCKLNRRIKPANHHVMTLTKPLTK